ncbi:hypothetical protein ABW19_dt0207158 [Dactylella cylindrospora]|nr:hypothetical protein ABW19_dt0207158 [Dactylella cylindrospora]
MRRNEKGKYDLETKLRTWTEYEKEQEEAAKTNPELAAQRAAKQARFHSMRKKWGGCPDGCTHGPQATHSHHSGGIDQNDKEVIEKAIATSMAVNGGDTKSKKKTSRPIVRVDPPSGITSSDEEGGNLSDTRPRTALIRGRDGGGSKSGFNSDYEAEDEIDSEREKQEICEENGKVGHSKAEKLGDMKSDSESGEKVSKKGKALF